MKNMDEGTNRMSKLTVMVIITTLGSATLIIGLSIAMPANTQKFGFIQILMLGGTAIFTLVFSGIKNWMSNGHETLAALRTGAIASAIASSGLILIAGVIDLGAIPVSDPAPHEHSTEIITQINQPPEEQTTEITTTPSESPEEWMRDTAAWVALATAIIILAGTLILIYQQTASPAERPQKNR